MHDLFNIEEFFQNYILHPSRSIPKIFTATKNISAKKRLNIYVHAYQTRLLEALSTSYPVLHAYLGDELFTKLGIAYLKTHPSPYRSIRWFGDELANFLAKRKECLKKSYIVELAQLEWTLSLIFDGADIKPVTLNEMSQIAPRDWETMKLEIHPAVKRLNLNWNVVQLWQSVVDEKTCPSPIFSKQPLAWIFWRTEDLSTAFCSLTTLEAWTFDAALKGATWGDLCEALCDQMDPEQVPTYIAALLKTWITQGLITRVTT